MNQILTTEGRVVFRTDASVEIGSGHVMRCLALADVLRSKGNECHFICHEHTGNLIKLIKKKGYCVHTLQIIRDKNSKEVYSISESIYQARAQPVYSSWLGTSQEDDAGQCATIFNKIHPDWLVVDHYSLGICWEKIVKPKAQRLMVIDDLVNRKHFADLLLDQNLGRKTDDYGDLVPETCQILVGPQYALIRPEFSELRDDSLKRRNNSSHKKILISMGSFDKDNLTGKILDGLKSCQLPKDCQITIILGSQSPWLDTIKTKAANMPWLAKVKININNMARQMLCADIAIGGAGTSSWERCCLGLPTLILVVANNQIDNAKALADSKAAILIDTTTDLHEALAAGLKELNDKNRFRQIANAAADITDGKGTSRVYDVMRINY